MRPSASRFDLLRSCQWWARYDVRPAKIPGSDAMDRGNRVHAAIEAILGGAQPLPLAADEQADVDAWRAWWTSAPRTGWRPEVALALLRGGKVVDIGQGRKSYERTPTGTRLLGTADAIAPQLVVDWKIGRHVDLVEAHEHPQLRLLAFLASRAFGWDTCRVALVHIHEGHVVETSAQLDPWDLDETAAEVDRLLAAVATAVPRPGEHCSHCPAQFVCPALATSLAVRPQADPLALAASLPGPAALALYEEAKRVEKLAAATVSVITRRAREQDLHDGKRRLVEATAEKVDAAGPGWPEAESMLLELGLGDAIERTTRATVSKASIERACKAKGLDAREVLARMRAAGVMHEVPHGFRLVNLRAHERSA